MWRSAFVCLILVTAAIVPVAFTTPVLAQTVSRLEPDVPEKAGKELRALRVITAAPRIDGRLDDDVWREAESIRDLVQIEPANMEPATERTRVQIAYDDRYIYVAVRCFARDASTIAAGLGRRDSFPQSDRIMIEFDPRHDHQTAYIFQTNPSGVQGDMILFDDTSISRDYDAVWEVRTQVDSEKWTAEFQIPFSQMRFDAPLDDAVWGLQVVREIAATGETARWVGTPRGVNGFVSRFGHLSFGQRLQPPRRLEILPFTLASSEHKPGEANRAAVSGGVDFRVGLGASTLSATVNPDFGQVEADPAVLNLSVFETFFPEKRPFFLEDSRVFVLPYGQAPDFYSRRIGQRPGRFALAGDETLVSKPERTTILGAVKLTGKAAGWTWGGLGAVTAREYAVVNVTGTDEEGNERFTQNRRRLIEPATVYNVGRIQRDIAGSNIGIIGTSVIRERDLDAFTGGPDYNLRWGKNRYNVNGHWLATRAPIDGVMRTGFGGLTNFSYDTKHVNVWAHIDHFGRHFRNSDLGFLSSRTNKNDVSGSVGLSQPDPWGPFRNVNGSAGFGQQWTGEGLVFGREAYGNLNATFKNYWYLGGGYSHEFTRLDDLDTRGGPPILRPASNRYNVGVWTDGRKRWGGNISFNTRRDVEGSWQRSIGSSFRIQPSDRLQANVSANYTFARDTAQWVKNVDLDGDGETDHIYGRLRRNVVSLTSRATYSFDRDLTLEAYLQPFVAAGDYSDIRRLALPRSFIFESASIENDPDFNNKSLRGTIVLRWEYLRGSTLFLVWNMATSDPTRDEFSPLRDLRAGFSSPGTHVFVAKLTYWFTP